MTAPSMLDVCLVRGDVVPGSRVLDLGAADGDFTRAAVAAGATVVAVDPDPANVVRLSHVCEAKWGAVGRRHGRGRLSKGPPSVVREGDDFPVWTLDEMVAAWGPFDVVKIDVEGDEYDALLASTLDGIGVLTVETHVWTQPGRPRVEGVGVQDRRFDPAWPDRLSAHICRSFADVGGFGDLATGATILARYPYTSTL